MLDASAEYAVESYDMINSTEYESLWAITPECSNCTDWLYSLRQALTEDADGKETSYGVSVRVRVRVRLGQRTLSA